MKKYNNPHRAEWPELLKRPTASYEEIEGLALDIFGEVKNSGDTAVRKFGRQFDGIDLQDFGVSEAEIKVAETQVSDDLKQAVEVAKGNIEKFHREQKTQRVEVETMPGVLCWQEKRPIEKVGLYIPGGTAPLFSTILMLAVPAKIAGCKDIVLCTPPNKEGNVHPAILYTAQLCGIEKVFKVGGVQAVAAMALGTETIPKVYKIFGPGNQYVTVAKQVSMRFGTAIDMPAGPSELLVVADDTAKASFVASDLLSQAEHGPDSQVILVSLSKQFIDKVDGEIRLQMAQLPRKEIAEKAMANSRLIFMEDAQKALELVNQYGPEHLIICTANEDFFVENVSNAGSVFIGNYTPESAGDYASGTNHTLPTNGYAKQYSGVNLDSFMKSVTFQKISEAGIKQLGPSIEIMAEAEQLQAHKNAVTLRLKELKTSPLERGKSAKADRGV
ncbi:MAG: histidinol dehydrogenase [Muricauda sp.]|nr:histidinol dehydrogenase [Allomuricauda sp.]MAU26979.1 histidinol dehydrogenase [Allomuricauda sp.]MBC29896.1 histidinol dehydrogenase [Allomuricauda sp.]|tara:strand:+ start:14152 stop:15483 length:1332 start_codon:yes stop_codon:yes gene_type:complete